MSEDWFRNTEWSDAIEQRFRQKLRRARSKEQYLRIQASTLARTHPEAALELLDQHFALPDDFDHAQAHVDRATAFLALGRVEAAIDSYEAALARECEFPNLQTQACLELPYVIATYGIMERYPRALELLEKHKDRLTFPVDHFRWHAAQALIAAARHDMSAAKAHAKQALEAATRSHSGFRYHPTVGLVTEQYDDLIGKLRIYTAE
jgi:tetratricopeptide (TPR) repeat protein